MFSIVIILGKGEFIMLKKLAAEFVATMILVLVGCGVAIGVACNNNDIATVIATAAAFGVSIIILAYTVGQVSGGHANPAVSLAMAIRGDISWKEFALYCLAQVLGALVGSAILALIFLGVSRGTGANAVQKPLLEVIAAAKITKENDIKLAGLGLAVLAEIVLTFLFIFAVLGITSKKENGSVAGLLIGAALFGVHLLGIPLTGTSVNPARGLSALVVDLLGHLKDKEIVQADALMLIPAVIAPFIGAALAAIVWKLFVGKKQEAKEAE